MSLPKLRTIPASRRDVKVSMQFAEQNLLKQKAHLDADMRKRQLELERTQHMFAISFPGVTASHTPAAYRKIGSRRSSLNNADDVGLRAIPAKSQGEPKNRHRRRHSLGNEALLPSSQTNSHVETGVVLKSGDSSKTTSAGRCSLEAGKSTHIPPVPRTNSQTSREEKPSSKAAEDDTRPIETAGMKDDPPTEKTQETVGAQNQLPKPEHSNRNAVFVFKHEERNGDDPNHSTTRERFEKAKSIFSDSTKPQDGSTLMCRSSAPAAAATRSRRKQQIIAMSPVIERDLPSTPEVELSEEPETSFRGSCGIQNSCNGTGCFPSSSPESKMHPHGEPKQNGVHWNRISKANDTSSPAVASLLQQVCLQTPMQDTALPKRSEDAEVTLPRQPKESYLLRRRRSIAVLEGIGSYVPRQTPDFEPRHSQRHSDPKFSEKSADSVPSQRYLARGRRGSTSVLHESLGRTETEPGSLPVLVPPSRDRSTLPGLCKAKPVRLTAEARRHMEKNREREAAWEYIRRSYYQHGSQHLQL